MNCPKCSEGFSVITATRHGDEVGRDRLCAGCGFTWETVERSVDTVGGMIASSHEWQPWPADDEPPDLSEYSLRDEVAYHRDRILELCNS